MDLKAIYWAAGPYDNIVIMEAQSEADMMAFSLAVKKLEFITSEGIRVFNKAEMKDVLANLARLQ